MKDKWRIEHDGDSLGMLISPSGRIFCIKELGVSAHSQWGNPLDNDAMIKRIVDALNNNGA